jgi:hypothetical protein
MPIISGKYQLHESMMLVIIAAAEMVSYFAAPFTFNLPLFYFVRMVGTVGYCKYAILRYQSCKTLFLCF